MADEQNQQKPEPSEREKRRRERLARVKSQTAPKRVRVVPKEELRKSLKHPLSGMRFQATGSAEWPYDTFTKRRIRDGDVTLEKQPEREGQEPRREEPPPAA